jgi:hypothetical protein
MVVSLVEAHEEEEIPDDRGVLSMLALILFTVVEEDVDESAAATMEDIEVLAALDAAAVAVEALAAAALRAALILIRLLIIDLHRRKVGWRSIIRRIS